MADTKRNHVVTVELTDVAEAIDKFVAEHPQFKASILRHLARKEAQRLCSKIASEIPTLAKGGL